MSKGISQRMFHSADRCLKEGSYPPNSYRVPDLGLDGLGVDLDAAGCEFDADGGFAVEVEFVAGEAREEVGFADAAVAYEDDFEEELRVSSAGTGFT